MQDQDSNNGKGRDFICACGKNYLSYAALFTHIKQKHDGKAPGPIIRPRSERKRGRPRKNPQQALESGQQQSKEFKDFLNNSPETIKQRKDNIQNQIQKKEENEQADIPNLGGAFKRCNPIKIDENKGDQTYRNGINKNDQSMEDKLKSSELTENQKLQHVCKRQIKRTIEGMLQPDEIEYSQITMGHLLTLSSELDKYIENKNINLKQAINDFLEQFFHEDIYLVKTYQAKTLLWLLICYIKKEQNEQLISIQEFKRKIFEFLETELDQLINNYQLQDVRLFMELNPTRFFISICNWLGLNEFKTLDITEVIVEENANKELQNPSFKA